MKTLFIEAKSSLDVLPVLERSLKYLKGKTVIFTTIQHIEEVRKHEALLRSKDADIIKIAQILGCSQPDIAADSIIYIGTGEFHPKALLLAYKKDIIIANPVSGKVETLHVGEIEKIERKKKVSLMKFLSSDRIGVLISTKGGQKTVQGDMKAVSSLREKYKGKEFFLFACNTLDPAELENFPFIQAWVNTMCPRIGLDDSINFKNSIINIRDLK